MRSVTRGERRQQRDRLEVGDVLRRARQRLHLGLAHADVVGEEDHVELGALGGLRDLDVVLEVDAGVGLRAADAATTRRDGRSD